MLRNARRVPGAASWGRFSGEGDEVGMSCRPEMAFQVLVRETDPSRVCSSPPGLREWGAGGGCRNRGCLPGKASLGRGGEFPASGPWGELQAGGVSKAQRTQEAQWRRRQRWGGG